MAGREEMHWGRQGGGCLDKLSLKTTSNPSLVSLDGLGLTGMSTASPGAHVPGWLVQGFLAAEHRPGREDSGDQARKFTKLPFFQCDYITEVWCNQHHLLGLAVGQPPCSGNGVEMQVGGDGPHSRPYSESKAGPKEGPWFLRVDHGSECAGVDSHLSGSP
jgi:hypothetical protein